MGERMCPFRKIIVYKDAYGYEVRSSTATISKEVVEFQPCLKHNCMAYNNGECKLIEKIGVINI